MVEIAALRMDGGVEPPFCHLVKPGVPIPAQASRIHGITDDDVREAQAFAEIIAPFERFIGDSVLVGHTIGFDLAVMDKEYARAGTTLHVPPSLDVRALARIAAPDLAGYSLETLCNWLDIEIARRHSALHDAEAAAKIYVKLVPLLRDRGVRTLAEAEAAISLLPGEERLHRISGWISPVRAIASDVASAVAAIDGYPFRHRVRDIVQGPPVMLDPQTPLSDVIEPVLNASGGAVLVGRNRRATGILTAHEVLRALALPRSQRPQSIAALSGADPGRVSEEDHVYRALTRMRQLGATHLCVENRRGEAIGILSAGALLDHRATSAMLFTDTMETAETVPQLARTWSRLPDLAARLLREGLEATEIGAIIAAEICALTERAARIAEAEMFEAGRGRPPEPYAVLVLGSAGRGNSLLSADQDNAIVFGSGDPLGPEDLWFSQAGSRIADILYAVGLPLLPGRRHGQEPGLPPRCGRLAQDCCRLD